MMNGRELEQITGGCDDLIYMNIKRDFERLKQQEEARQKAEAAITPAHTLTAAVLPAAGKKLKTVAVSMAGYSHYFFSCVVWLISMCFC